MAVFRLFVQDMPALTGLYMYVVRSGCVQDAFAQKTDFSYSSTKTYVVVLTPAQWLSGKVPAL